MLVTFLACVAMTSCDEDLDEAMTLAGEWYGDFGMSYDYKYYGRVYTFRSYESDVVFYPHHDYATYGTGTQVDYYREGPYERMYYNFRWTIRDGVIYLKYPYEDSYLDTEISDYQLSDGLFRGYFGWTDTRFRLHKITGYYDWSPYTDRYGYFYNYGWSWGWYGTRSDSATTVPTDGTGTVTRIGNIQIR